MESPRQQARLKGCHDLQALAFWDEERAVYDARLVIETQCRDQGRVFLFVTSRQRKVTAKPRLLFDLMFYALYMSQVARMQ